MASVIFVSIVSVAMISSLVISCSPAKIRICTSPLCTLLHFLIFWFSFVCTQVVVVVVVVVVLYPQFFSADSVGDPLPLHIQMGIWQI